MRLSDTVVVELGARIGAGVCGSLLAHLGAQVVFVEPREPRNDWKWRDRPQFAADKLSIRIDVSRPDDLDLLRATIARADVIITSTDLPDALQAEVGNHARDSAIHCAITAYGNTGPRAGRADD